MMNKRTKAKRMKRIGSAVTVLSCALLVWGVLSWVDVVSHNMSDQNYAWWNLIVLFTKIAAVAVG